METRICGKLRMWGAEIPCIPASKLYGVMIVLMYGNVNIADVDYCRNIVDDAVHGEPVACNVSDKLVAEIDDGVVVEPLVFCGR